MSLVRIREEFEGISTGDHRLNMRVLRVVEKMEQRPSAPYPVLFSSAERQGLEHLISHEDITPDVLLAPHYHNTAQRASVHALAYVLHDSSNITHGGGSEGRDFYDLSGSTYGYVSHVSLLITPDRCPIGIGNVSFVQREKERVKGTKTKGKNENARWMEAVETTAARFAEQALVHIMDSEADSYEIIASLQQRNHRFIVRGDERYIAVHNGRKWTRASLVHLLQQQPVLLRREVVLSARHSTDPKSKRNPSRQERLATLTVRTGRVKLLRPENVPGTGPRGQAIRTEVNVVLVEEDNAPQGTTAVRWVLFTSEPIDTIEQSEAVVDGYRTRWVIEELFKSLKTGCSFEQRRFALQYNSQNALALTLPMAWQLLLLRHLERQHSNDDARIFFGPELPILRAIAKTRLPSRLTIHRALLAIAELGGHRKADGPPGWLVLARGMAELTTAVQLAHRLMRAAASQQRERDL